MSSSRPFAETKRSRSVPPRFGVDLVPDGRRGGLSFVATPILLLPRRRQREAGCGESLDLPVPDTTRGVPMPWGQVCCLSGPGAEGRGASTLPR